MKIIDQKGKLFGLINIIDLCVLLIIVLLVGVVGYKAVGGKIGKLSVNSSKHEVLVTTDCYGLRIDEVAGALKKDDQLISLTSPVDAYIVSNTSTVAEDVGVNSSGNYVMTTNPLRKDIIITFKMNVDTNSSILKLGSQDVAVGKGLEIKTKNVDIMSVVSSIVIK